MTYSRRMIIGLAAGLILIAAGLGTGFALKTFTASEPAPSLPEAIVAGNIPEKAPPSPANKKLYIASAPSQGRAYIATPILFENIFNSHAIVMLKKDQAGEIAEGQKIFLYGADGMLQDAVGTVVMIEEGKGANTDSKIVHITLNPLPDGTIPAPARGEIVTNEITQTYRLPVTALQPGTDGNSYIWEAITQNGRITAKKRSVEGLKKPGAYFIMGRPDYISNIYLLNPDDALRDGQVIKIKTILYSPGTVPSVDQIASLPRIEPEIELPTPSGAACATSCEAGAGGAAGFIQHIKDLGAAMPKQSKPEDSPSNP